MAHDCTHHVLKGWGLSVTAPATYFNIVKVKVKVRVYSLNPKLAFTTSQFSESEDTLVMRVFFFL